MSVFSFSYSRPNEGSHSPKMRILGAVGSFFDRALDHKKNLDNLSISTLGSAQFFEGKNVVRAAFVEVPFEKAHRDSPNFMVHFQTSYDLRGYNEETQAFLSSLAPELREAFEFIFKLASERDRKRASESDVKIFREHMLRICEAFDLTDPLLKDYESNHASAFSRGITPPQKIEKIDKKREKIEEQISIILSDTDELTKAKAVRSLRDAFVGYHADLKGLKAHLDNLQSLKGHGARAAKTMLYSRITNNIADDNDELRDRLYNELVAAPDTKTRANIIRDLVDDLTGAKNLAGRFKLFSQKLSRSPDRQTDALFEIRRDAEILAQEFEAIRSDCWLDHEIAIYKQAIKVAEDVFSSNMDLAKDYFTMENDKVVFTNFYTQWKFSLLQKLYLADDLEGEQLDLVNLCAEGILPERRRKLSDSDYLNADHILAKKSIGEKNPSEAKILSAMTDKSHALLKDEDTVIYMISSGRSKLSKKDVLRLHRAAMAQPQTPARVSKSRPSVSAG